MKMEKVLALKEQIPINEKLQLTIPISFFTVSVYQTVVQINHIHW